MANTPPLKLTRNQLAAFLKDHESIKAFENLFNLTEAIAPEAVQDALVAAESAGASALQAQALALQAANDALSTAAVAEARANVALQTANDARTMAELAATAPQHHVAPDSNYSSIVAAKWNKSATVSFAELIPTSTTLFTENFVSDSGQFTRYTENTLATFTVAGQATVTNSTGSPRNDLIVTGADLSMPQVAVQIDVVSRSGTPSGYDNIGVGIIKDANNFVLAGYDRIANSARIQVKIGGVNTFNAAVSKTWTAPYKIGFSLIANSACMYVDTGAGWEYVTGYAIPTGTINFKTAALTGWKSGFTVATPNNSTWVFDTLIAGRFGGFGFRDFTMITAEDGTPYISGGLAYLTGTCADGLGTGHQGIFTLNTTTYALVFVGCFMVSRGGATQNDVACHLIRYSDASWRVTTTTWGNGFGGVLDLISGTTTQTLLSGSFIVSGLTKLTLPTQEAGFAAYDGQLIRTDGVWKLAHSISTNTTFVGSPFYPALCESSDLSTWTETGVDSGARPFEGTKWVIWGGGYYITAGNQYQCRVYDESLNWRGYLQATLDGGTVTQPHAAIFYSGGRYVLLTFNKNKPAGNANSFTWGQMVVHEAAP